MKLFFGFRVKRLYRNEFRSLWVSWESLRSAGTDLDLRIQRVRTFHNGCFRMALRKVDASGVYGPDGDPEAKAALERSLLEPWAQSLLQMTAADVLTHEPAGHARPGSA